VPKKLFHYGAQFHEAFADAPHFGWKGDGMQPPTDWATLLANKNTEIRRLNGIYSRLLGNAGVKELEGHAKITGPNSVSIGGRTLTAANILVATGSKASVPPGIEGTDLPGVINSDQALVLSERPKKVIIYGSGFIAVEFAGIFHGFGAETHLCYRAPLPLRNFDDDCRAFLAEQYEAKGVHMHPGEVPQKVEQLPGGGLRLVTDKGSHEGDVVMFATGRVPNTQGIGLEEAGVELGRKGEIKVDEFNRTRVPSIWAIGDCIGKVMLTPVALMEGMRMAETAFGPGPAKPGYELIPAAVFSDPELGTVGWTEAEAIEKAGEPLHIYLSKFKPLKYTMVEGAQTKTLMKMIVGAESDKVYGVHMVGADAPEIMQGIGVALKAGAKKSHFDSTIGIHPTAAEELVTFRTITRTVEPASKL
jgi:glutathione reductase (NADPH)